LAKSLDIKYIYLATPFPNYLKRKSGPRRYPENFEGTKKATEVADWPRKMSA
jgi:hypothetical protein